MLHVASAAATVLYTGDFKLRPSLTAEPAAPPKAEVLIMESTYGKPCYRLPPREEAIGQLVSMVSRVLDAGRTPVVRAYVLGKAQEVTCILAKAGFRVVQHPLVYAISQIYQQFACDMGPLEPCDNDPPADAVVIAPPRSQRAATITGLKRPVFIAVTGWAIDPAMRWRLGADYAVPLSDHADFDELIECIERVEPAVVFCTHGPSEFVEVLKSRGVNAHPLEDCRQGRPLELYRRL
jgi:Cft2 family RNA processing exonuclease